MTILKTNILEAGLAIIVLLSIAAPVIYFYDLTHPTPDSPFSTYNTHSGIIRLSIASMMARMTFTVCFFLLTLETYKQNSKILIIYLLSALLIGFLQWFELYYGSTFYYGEVRDKQGLTFPILASLLATFVIWKVNYTSAENRNRMIKVVLTAIVNTGLCFLWTQVYEHWNLGQS